MGVYSLIKFYVLLILALFLVPTLHGPDDTLIEELKGIY